MTRVCLSQRSEGLVVQQGKNIRVKENLENKGANGNSNNAGCWKDSPGLVAGRKTQPQGYAGRRARGVTAPPWKLGIKEEQTAGKDGLSGLLSVYTDQSERRGMRDRVSQAAALTRFRFLSFLLLPCSFSPETGSCG